MLPKGTIILRNDDLALIGVSFLCLCLRIECFLLKAIIIIPKIMDGHFYGQF